MKQKIIKYKELYFSCFIRVLSRIKKKKGEKDYKRTIQYYR
ncbi:hypothetical protein BACSTE_03338 [Bacteroides stercoris ATCC 43183]|uniref:Uncharacterized protein n=1 Tax=Bacteroides stercoris ATCC 43183 TaxID=449673 RepID=B0NV01_BACSE|nr:hypothetical protein BACSTE_03338 [Bacteroides stercoris ATCC 43183]